MNFWFHRGPLKSTTATPFDLKLVASNAETLKICSELKKKREHLINSFANVETDKTQVETLLTDYLSLLRGFFENADTMGGDTSRLRDRVKFKWTHSMLGSTLLSQTDAIYELVSICQEYAFWLAKRTSIDVMKSNDLNETQLKEIYLNLRQAIGVLVEIKTTYIPMLEDHGPPGSDLDTKVLDAYINQYTAEAQEITICRAISLGHAPSLIAALADEVSQKFLEAAVAVKVLDISKFGKWMHYFQIKCCCYGALTYSFKGDDLRKMEKCGEAIKCCQEGLRRLEVLTPLCKEYSKMKGLGCAPKCDQSLFFQRIKNTVSRLKERAERENTLIYHHKVPVEVPKLDLTPTQVLVVPVEFKIPAINILWTPFACAAFEHTINTQLKNLSIKESSSSNRSSSKDKDKKKDKKSPK